MGNIDISEKILEDHNDVFADIVNTLLFDGREVIDENDLISSKDRSQLKADDGTLHEQERDVAKIWKKGEIRIAFYGMENQTEEDARMPLRVIAYDGASYKSQLLEGDETYPVVTLVLYFGTKIWTKPTTLYECFGNIPEDIRPYLNDYKINLFPIAFLSDEKVQQFKSDFGIVADFFVQKRKNNGYIPSTKQIKYVDEFLKLMQAITGDKKYTAVNEKGGVRTMCDVLQKAISEGKTEGRMEGRILSLYNDSHKTPEEIVEITGQPLEEVNRVLAAD